MWVLPYDSASANGLDIMNEILSVIILYHVIIFTDWVPEPEIRYFFGKILITVTLSVMSIHILKMLGDNFRHIKTYLRQKKL